MVTRLSVTIALLAGFGCRPAPEPARIPVAATAVALDPTTVEIRFTELLGSTDGLALSAAGALDGAPLSIRGHRSAEHVLTVETAPQVGGVLYALRLEGLVFAHVATPDAPSQLNFAGFGGAEVTLRLDTSGFIVGGELAALVTVDPATGAHSDELHRVPLTALGSIHSATLTVRVDAAARFAARAVEGEREASALADFTVSSTAAITVELEPRLPRVPEFDPPVDAMVGDGLAPIRVVFDDRPARALERPELRTSLNARGEFDLATARVDAMRPVAGKPRVYELVLSVKVDPARVIDGTSPTDFPYIGFLVEKGEDIPERGITFVVPDERPQVIVVPIGNPALVPVTFRVDVGSAFVKADGSVRGLYPGEGIFLTGEFPAAEDALGRLAGDAFSGGERATLEMKRRPDAPMIFEHTVFMRPSRPYGWKVVRCPTGVGCGQLNRHVTSSGRAFPTVMKNLVSANLDAAARMDVELVDPAALGRFANARVSADGRESPSDAVLFKQEAPDLVVTVGRTPLVTPIYVVGTWRDINLPSTPAELVRMGGMIDLGPYDYDDGLVGRAPLLRDRMLPIDPGTPVAVPGQPAFAPTDGAADGTARQLSAPGRLPLWVGWNERELYVATSAAMPGRDHFIFVSFDEPTMALRAQWAKGGTGAAGARTAFLAMEGDGDFAGWFRRGMDARIDGTSARSGKGAVLEGAIDPAALGLGPVGGKIWVAAVAYGTADGGTLAAEAQHPAGNGDATLDRAEYLELELSAHRAR